MLRRKPVVDSDHRHSGIVRNAAADVVVTVETAQDEAAAMHVDDAASIGSIRHIVAQGYIAGRAGTGQIAHLHRVGTPGMKMCTQIVVTPALVVQRHPGCVCRVKLRSGLHKGPDAGIIGAGSRIVLQDCHIAMASFYDHVSFYDLEPAIT